MKKRMLLLLTMASMAAQSEAQERANMNRHLPSPMEVDYASFRQRMHHSLHEHHPGTANKTTAGGSRWYNYNDYFDLNETAMSSSIGFSLPYMWGSDDGLAAYSDGSGGTTFDTIRFVSMNMVLDPSFYVPLNDGFNEYDYFDGEMKITATDAYTIDSVMFTGTYLVNPAKLSPTGPIDTLRVSVIHGTGVTGSDIVENTVTVASGSPLTNYTAVGSPMKIQRVGFSGGNRVAAGTTMQQRDILLNNTTTPPSWEADTVNGIYVGKVKFDPPITINPGEMVGVSVSFLSGDNTFTPYDTVFFGSPTVPPVKYNMFRGAVGFRGTSSSVQFPPYNSTDRNTGSFASRTTSTGYSPQWYWYAGTLTSAADIQYPDISVKATCATCGTVTTKVTDTKLITASQAYPVPAVTEINIPYRIKTTADMDVTLTNMLGQTVAQKTIANASTGIATLDVSKLPAGLYTYTLSAGNSKTTGKVTVVK